MAHYIDCATQAPLPEVAMFSQSVSQSESYTGCLGYLALNLNFTGTSEILSRSHKPFLLAACVLLLLIRKPLATVELRHSELQADLFLVTPRIKVHSVSQLH
jgi:hypothetical protein